MTEPLLLPAPTTTEAVQHVLEALAVRETIEARLGTLFDELTDQVPGLRPHRAFSDGAWVLGVHTGGRLGSEALDFSRLDVELRVDGPVELVARTTIRDRDHPADTLRVAWDDPGRHTVGDFLEQACLTFAERFWTRA